MDNFRVLSPDELSRFMPCELECIHPGGDNIYPWVFRSQNNDEFQRLQSLRSTAGGTFTDNGAIKQKITNCLGHTPIFYILDHHDRCLFQFWAPVVIGDRKYLTISDQPFALMQLLEGLCSYRKICLDYLLPVDDINAEEARLGPVERVFRNGLPEFTLDIRHYSSKEYLQRDRAVDFGVVSYLALPVFEPLGCNCVGVLEVVSSSFGIGKYTVDTLIQKCKEVDLRSYDIYRDFGMHNSESSQKALCDIKMALKEVCETHELPLAQTWVSSSEPSGKERVMVTEGGSHVRSLDAFSFENYYDNFYIQKGQGVVGKAFSSKGACFCKNISQLSISEYPLVPSARKLRLTGCFAICLRSIHTGDFIYLIEVFLPHNETHYSDDARIFLKQLMETMKQQFKSFKVAAGQELGETLFVEILKTSSTDELDSFEICHFSGIASTAEVAELQQNNAKNVIVVCLDQNQVTRSPSRDELHNIGGIVPPRSSHQQLPMKLDNVVRERNTDTAEQCDINDSGNQRATKRIDRDYGITIEVLQQHSAKKLEEATKVLGVSRSTLKRICRKHNIYRWPPRTAKRHNCSDSLNHHKHVGDSSLKELPLGNLPIEDAHTKEDATRLQGGSSMVVKVTYQNDIVKFIFLPSSGKLDLEEEVAKRFNLSIGSFNLKYLDEDDDLILVTCDADLRTCISILTSLGKNTIKMSVNMLQANSYQQFDP